MSLLWVYESVFLLSILLLLVRQVKQTHARDKLRLELMMWTCDYYKLIDSINRWFFWIKCQNCVNNSELQPVQSDSVTHPTLSKTHQGDVLCSGLFQLKLFLVGVVHTCALPGVEALAYCCSSQSGLRTCGRDRSPVLQITNRSQHRHHISPTLCHCGL